MSAIAVENVSKHWTTADGQVRAVDAISFELAEGTFNVLLGPSGCGKSTTLRLIAGLEAADGGRVVIGGRDVTRLPPAQRNIAMVFQSYALFPHLSVAENILFGLHVRRVSDADCRTRLARVAELLGLAPLLARKPSQLSGGQQQRVASWTSRCQTSTLNCARRCAWRSALCSASSASRWCTSRTTRSRRCRWPIA